ncbi:hypothetical protein FXF46_06190 [Gluconobacter thailandicus]|uniref:Uncharacterized protein n=2 Tax=Gluconobacter thailandicus TaxID=257438 RepID=A0AAP9JHY9_GLUTH|nr:hypothetical protein FXF46_06190 [Gluconobacter thailandicus]
MPQDGYGIEDVMGREDARAHLAALETFQGKMIEELTCPLWYAPVIGGLFAMLTYAMSLERPFMFALEGECFAITAALYAVARRRLGYFVNGYRRGRTRKIAFGLLMFLYCMMGLSGAGAWIWHLGWLPTVAAAASFLAGCWGSVLWQRAWRADMTAEL